MNGMIPLSCVADSPGLRDLRERSIAKILADVSSNGTLGGEIPPGDYSQNACYWGRMIIVLALEAYAECVGPHARPRRIPVLFRPSPPPRTIHVAAAAVPRPASGEDLHELIDFGRRRLHGISTSSPRRCRDPPPRATATE